MKAWCIWCEDGEQQPKSGMVWIHAKCFQELMDIHRDIEEVKKYMKGEMPRIMASGDRQGYESVERFLIAMDDFRRRWANSMEYIAKILEREAQP